MPAEKRRDHFPASRSSICSLQGGLEMVLGRLEFLVIECDLPPEVAGEVMVLFESKSRNVAQKPTARQPDRRTSEAVDAIAVLLSDDPAALLARIDTARVGG